MWRKLLKWLLVPILEEAEPVIANWIAKEKDALMGALKEADSMVIAKQITNKIREVL
ncbi:MAG: hypothetical protein WC390_09195 [Sulfurimonas sp.]|jgi:hypothetical protein